MAVRKKAVRKPTERSAWEAKFTEKLALYHRKNVPALARKLMKRLDGVKNSMVARSKKYGVECTITVEDLREMAYAAYGHPCQYTQRIMKYDNMVFDHRIPISKGGTSNPDNIQAISRFANNMKGSLVEEHFTILLAWLASAPEELAKDVSIRLAHGIR